MLGNFEKEAEDEAVKQSNKAIKLLEELGAEVYTNLPAVNTVDEARSAWNFFTEKKVDGIVLFNGTFSLSNLMIEIIRNMDLPYLVWSMEEYLLDKGILTGSMIGTMPAGPIFKNLDKKYTFAYGTPGKEKADKKVGVFMRVLRAIAYLREARIGLIGARPDGFEISGFDELSIKKIFGTTINKVSMNELLGLVDGMDEKKVEADLKVQKEIFDTGDTSDDDMKSLSRIYLAVKEISQKYNLSAYAPQCWPELRMDRKTPMCPANGRITADGVMASCECDMDCTLTMLILYAISGSTPWTNDFVNLIEENDSLLFWHCGNASYNLSDAKPKIEVVFEGPAQTATLKKGAATVCRVNHFKGGFEVFAGIGQAIDSRPMLKGSNMYLQMAGGNMEFVETMLKRGVPHHNVAIYGDLAEELEEFANLTGLPATIIK
jgi:L-fucose isomerase-like protein